MTLFSAAVIVGLRLWKPRWPGFLIAVVASASIVAALGLPVATIGTRFGGISSSLPMPALPDLSSGRMLTLLPTAIAIAVLGSIESLLSAVVADAMTGGRHRPSIELLAQGAANIGCALFGGICATGTIARTATNIRARAHGPMAGMLHALFLLAFMMLAAPLASAIPLASLAAVLAIVAWNMIDAGEVRAMLRGGGGDAAVMLTTFLVTILRDLAYGMAAGILLALALWLVRRIRSV